MAKSFFKLEHSLEGRQGEGARIMEKSPDRIPDRVPVVAFISSVTLFLFMRSPLIRCPIGVQSEEGGDQVIQLYKALWLLQASLIGFAIFMGWMIERFYYYVKELEMLRKRLEAMKDAKGIGKASDKEDD